MLIPCSYTVGVTDDRHGGTRGLGCSTPTRLQTEGQGLSATWTPQKLVSALTRIWLEIELLCSQNPFKINYSCNCRWCSDQLCRYQEMLHRCRTKMCPEESKDNRQPWWFTLSGVSNCFSTNIAPFFFSLVLQIIDQPSTLFLVSPMFLIYLTENQFISSVWDIIT